MKDPSHQYEEPVCSLPADQDQSGIKPLALDPDKYRDYLDDFDLDEAQQNELLEVIWNVMRSFVEMGFGLDSVQMLLPAIAEKAGMKTNDSVKQMKRVARFNQLAGPIQKEENKEKTSDE